MLAYNALMFMVSGEISLRIAHNSVRCIHAPLVSSHDDLYEEEEEDKRTRGTCRQQNRLTYFLSQMFAHYALMSMVCGKVVLRLVLVFV